MILLHTVWRTQIRNPFKALFLSKDLTNGHSETFMILWATNGDEKDRNRTYGCQWWACPRNRNWRSYIAFHERKSRFFVRIWWCWITQYEFSDRLWCSYIIIGFFQSNGNTSIATITSYCAPLSQLSLPFSLSTEATVPSLLVQQRTVNSVHPWLYDSSNGTYSHWRCVLSSRWPYSRW